MERLTYWDSFDSGALHGQLTSFIVLKFGKDRDVDYIEQAINRLAAYEDTNLSPDEITALKAENERLNAELKNSVKLPCKIGDTVYFVGVTSKRITGLWTDGEIFERIADEIAIDIRGYRIHSFAKETRDENMWGYINDRVFITREAAEARLKELEAKK